MFQVSPLTSIGLGKRSLDSSDPVHISVVFCLKPNVNGERPLLWPDVLQLSLHFRPPLRPRPLRPLSQSPRRLPRRLRRLPLLHRPRRRRHSRQTLRHRHPEHRLLALQPRRHPRSDSGFRETDRIEADWLFVVFQRKREITYGFIGNG